MRGGPRWGWGGLGPWGRPWWGRPWGYGYGYGGYYGGYYNQSSGVIVVNSSNQAQQQDSDSYPTATATLVGSSSSSGVIGTATIVRSEHKEVRTLEYKDGDVPVRYFLDIPTGVPYDTDTVIEMNGRRMTIRIPRNVSPGERIVVVAPNV